MSKQKTHEEWFVGVRVQYRVESGDNAYLNAYCWYPGYKPGDRYVRTEDEARRVLDYAYRLRNGERFYDADGKRYEHHAAGTLGIGVECTRETDAALKIVGHIIKKRIVTEWEVVDD